MAMVGLSLFFQAEDGIRGDLVTGVQTCALPILELGVPADVVVGAGMELLAVLVAPRFLDVVATVDDDAVRIPVLALARHVVAALEDQDLLPGRRQSVRERAATRSGPDDDHVILVVGHRPPPGASRAR